MSEDIYKEITLLNQQKVVMQHQLNEIKKRISELKPRVVDKLLDAVDNEYWNEDEGIYVAIKDDLKVSFLGDLNKPAVYKIVEKTGLKDKVKRTIHGSTLKEHISTCARTVNADMRDPRKVMRAQEKEIRDFLEIEFTPDLTYAIPKYNNAENKRKLFAQQKPSKRSRKAECNGCTTKLDIHNLTIDHIKPPTKGRQPITSRIYSCFACLATALRVLARKNDFLSASRNATSNCNIPNNVCARFMIR